MGLIKNIDLSAKSEPIDGTRTIDCRKIMQGIKEKNANRKGRALKRKANKKICTTNMNHQRTGLDKFE